MQQDAEQVMRRIARVNHAVRQYQLNRDHGQWAQISCPLLNGNAVRRQTVIIFPMNFYRNLINGTNTPVFPGWYVQG